MAFHTRLFVGNLPENTSEGELLKAFAKYGNIVNVDLKFKQGSDDDKKSFAFITLSASNYDVESCIQHFTSEVYKGNKLHVTRARESFLERLQKERREVEFSKEAKSAPEPVSFIKKPILNLGETLNPRKRRQDVQVNGGYNKPVWKEEQPAAPEVALDLVDIKKRDSDKKRLESMKKMRKEFAEKKLIIKSGLAGVDKSVNKKVIFSDNEETVSNNDYTNVHKKRNGTVQNGNAGKFLFDDNDSANDDDGLNFEIKEQFEGKKGQKVLELQTRFKSDKRFTLDKRFIEDDNSGDESRPQKKMKSQREENDDQVQGFETDEKLKQLNILQNVLGISIRSSLNRPEVSYDSKKSKARLGGMLRFDPNQPDHAKFLAPVDSLTQEAPKTNKKKKAKEKSELSNKDIVEVQQDKVEVSKEQFYKVSDSLKETIAQPNSFNIRSLFGVNEEEDEGDKDQDVGYMPLIVKPDNKVKNPLDKGSKNPFKYDSSDSEPEIDEEKHDEAEKSGEGTKTKAVWREKLFFSRFDTRFKEALAFFNTINDNENKKERRELKNLMKKRLYNKSRKDQMFQKKIGGKRKANGNKMNNKRR